MKSILIFHITDSLSIFVQLVTMKPNSSIFEVREVQNKKVYMLKIQQIVKIMRTLFSFYLFSLIPIQSII